MGKQTVGFIPKAPSVSSDEPVAPVEEKKAEAPTGGEVETAPPAGAPAPEPEKKGFLSHLGIGKDKAPEAPSEF
jgi:hypothetical protein